MAETKPDALGGRMKAAVCECGDWQWQHVGGEERCLVCSESRAPWDGCMQFRGHQFDEMTAVQEEAMRAADRARGGHGGRGTLTP